ncbi:MAG: hypothetical protein L6Q84_00235 [Polyangiaceae bacterium]|nr:hypothetical protein [Polyangiaceae bacterium]
MTADEEYVVADGEQSVSTRNLRPTHLEHDAVSGGEGTQARSPQVVALAG